MKLSKTSYGFLYKCGLYGFWSIAFLLTAFEFLTTLDLRTIDEATSQVVSMENTQVIDKAFDGKVVHVKGKLDVHGEIVYSFLGVEEKGLYMRVEAHFFQWAFRSGAKASTLSRIWIGSPQKNDALDSKHDNTLIMNGLGSHYRVPRLVTLGAYAIDNQILPYFSTHHRSPHIAVSQAKLKELHNLIVAQAFNNTKQSESIVAYNNAIEKNERPGMLVHEMGNTVYFGLDPNNPRIGDIELTLSLGAIPTEEVGIIGRISNGTLQIFEDSGGFSKGMVAIGAHNTDIQKMLFDERDGPYAIRWYSRILGFFVFFVSLRLMSLSLSVGGRTHGPWGASLILTFVSFGSSLLLAWLIIAIV